MPQPSFSEVHVDRPLTSISVAFLQNGQYVAPQVFPIIRTSKASDSFFTYDRDYWFRSGQVLQRAPGTESAGSGYTISTSTYNTVRIAIHKDVDDPTRDNADEPLDLNREAAEFTAMQIAIDIERRWAGDFFTTSVWNADTTPGTLWDVATSDPIADIEARALVVMENTGLRPNTLVLGAQTWSDGLKNHPDLLDRIKYTQRGIVTADLLAAALDLQRVLVATATSNTATEGATGSYDFIAGQNDALLLYTPPNPGRLTPAAGYTFVWTGAAGADNEMGVRTKRFRMEEIESERIETETWFDHVRIAQVLGEFFSNVAT